MVLGAKPVLADVIAGEWTLDPADAASRITERTRAIIAVNLFGMPARIAELSEFGIPVIEDCAHGIGGDDRRGPVRRRRRRGDRLVLRDQDDRRRRRRILAARDEALVERARARARLRRSAAWPAEAERQDDRRGSGDRP